MRLDAATFRCNVSWRYRLFRYTGSVKVWYRPDSQDRYWYYSFRIKRREQRCTTTPDTPRSPRPDSRANRCIKIYIVR